MNRFSDHPTDAQLQEFIDHRESAPGVKDHLEGCPRCREAFRAMSRVDRALKTLPLSRTGEDFTTTVMSRIGAGASSSLLFRLLGSVAHIVGLFAVLGIMIGIFLFAGVIDRGTVEQGGTVVQQNMQRIGDSISSGMTAFNTTVRNLLPFAFGHESGLISLLVIAVVSLLAVADRFLGRKFVAR